MPLSLLASMIQPMGLPPGLAERQRLQNALEIGMPQVPEGPIEAFTGAIGSRPEDIQGILLDLILPRMARRLLEGPREEDFLGRGGALTNFPSAPPPAPFHPFQPDPFL